jgi:hypothetical protein
MQVIAQRRPRRKLHRLYRSTLFLRETRRRLLICNIRERHLVILDPLSSILVLIYIVLISIILVSIVVAHPSFRHGVVQIPRW